jgi:two-component system, sensor histidine kinase and response regulator
MVLASRNFVMLSITLWLLQASIGFGPRLGIENYLYVVLVVLLVLETETKWRHINVSVIALGLVCIKLYNEYYPPFYDVPALTKYLYVSNIVLSCMFIGIICWSMLDDTQNEQKNVLKKKQQLSETNELKDKLFAMISHDIISPLNSLNGMLSLLENEMLPRELQKQLIHDLRQKTEISGKTLKALLDWSAMHYKQQATAITKSDSRFDLYEATHTINQFFDNELRKKQISFVNDVPNGTYISADKDQIQFVIRNLAGNAIKYCKTDGSGQIIIRARTDNENINLDIIDNGIGIEPSRQVTLFGSDDKVSTEGTANEKGTGLGLIFCKEFVTAHGGEINVSSQPGMGTTFSITLPIDTNNISAVGKKAVGKL